MAELVANLSLADISPQRRSAVLNEVAGSVAGLLKEQYPASDGYGHQARTFVRFKERPTLLGHRLWVRRDSLWGYRVEVSPADFQLGAARVTLTRFSPLNEALAACCAVPAMALMVGLLIYDLCNWGTWKDYRDPVLILLFPPLALGLGLFAILKCLSWPFVARKTGKQAIAKETAILRQSLHEVLVAPAVVK